MDLLMREFKRMKKTRDSSDKKSSSSMKTSIQFLIQKFTAVLFEKDELGLR